MKHTSVASGLALAYLSAHAHAFPALLTRKDKWENPDGGNTDVQVGDKKINWGSKPPWDALNEIKDHCLSNGCNGDDKLTVKTKILDGDTLDEGEISISIDGTFAEEGEDGNIDQLTDLVKAAVANSNYDVKTETYAEGYSCSVGTPFGCDRKCRTLLHQHKMNIANANRSGNSHRRGPVLDDQPRQRQCQERLW